MSDRYDFANLSPIEFEGLCVDLVSAETGLRFERFSVGADGGVDGRHSRASDEIVLQAKHYKNSTWSDLKKAVKLEKKNVHTLNPTEYYFVTSQPLTVARKSTIVSLLDHPSVTAPNVWGRSEMNAYITAHADVERRNIKLWLSSATVLERLLTNEIAVFTEATADEIERILKIFVVNPSLQRSEEILKATHNLIVSGPPGVGKTTLAQFIAARYIEAGWELVAISKIDEGFRAFHREKSQIFVFDDFLGKIRLDPVSLGRADSKIVKFMSKVHKDKRKKFVLTTRSYILHAARTQSEALDDREVELSEMVLNLATYTRELKARILYNHLYHSEIDEKSIQSLLDGDTVRRIVDHSNYMPRIIQWMTDELRQRDTPPAEYPNAFLQTLNYPDKIWDKAFKKHITTGAQVLLYCLFFCERDIYPVTGVNLNKLRIFFEKSMVGFNIIAQEQMRSAIFDETVREVKSSFVIIDCNIANFINPSIQDYLSRETSDATVLLTLARCVPTLATAVSFWNNVKTSVDNVVRVQIANELLESLIAGRIDGRLPLDEIADFCGQLVGATGGDHFCERIRVSDIRSLFWINEPYLPSLIEAFEEGKFRYLPHARAYARYLRMELSRYLDPERNHEIELEELATLASYLQSSQIEIPEVLFDNFVQAAVDAVDILDMDAIGHDDDPEEVIGGWLEHIASIKSFTSAPVDYLKESEFEERISAIQYEEDLRSQWEEDVRPQTGADFQSQRPISSGSFTNDDLQSMFSSLKKSS